VSGRQSTTGNESIGEVIARLPDEPGVYRFRDAAGRALYIGRASRLRSRVRSYWGDLGDRRHLARMVPRIDRVEAVVCASVHEASWLERSLLEESRPRWNRAVGGAEVGLMMVVDRQPPRIRILHETGIPPADELIFGPFLGGVKVRLLAAAVHRIYPIVYTRDALTSAERDLGRIRGVAPGDRLELMSSVIGVLSRDPAAVAGFLDLLVERRDAASALGSYELASQIQSEWKAASFLLAPQRLAVGPARATSEAADLCGWHDGTLVEFRWRAGRIRDWRVLQCGADLGHRRADATPPQWREFAELNARLAASLWA